VVRDGMSHSLRLARQAGRKLAARSIVFGVGRSDIVANLQEAVGEACARCARERCPQANKGINLTHAR
jgi:hypothetical protein